MPDDPTTIASSSLTMCKRVDDNGFFGVYNGAYRTGMGPDDPTPTDPRALAFVSSLDKCTQ